MYHTTLALGTAFLCGSQLARFAGEATRTWRGTQCSGACLIWLQRLDLCLEAMGKRDWARDGQGNSVPLLALSRSGCTPPCALSESRQSVRHNFRLSYFAFNWLHDVPTAPRTTPGNMDSSMEYMQLEQPCTFPTRFVVRLLLRHILHSIPDSANCSSYSSSSSSRPASASASAACWGVAALSRIPAPISSRLFCLLSIAASWLLR